MLIPWRVSIFLSQILQFRFFVGVYCGYLTFKSREKTATVGVCILRDRYATAT